MPRNLALALEPSDAFVGLLRLNAVIEAGRWPAEISEAFRATINQEFSRLEDTVRTLGLCFADLEESGVAEIDRAPQSRFDDIDGALHLCACTLTVSLDLDHLLVALEHGDRPARESIARLALTLRSLLWYLSRTELFVCTHLSLSDRELPPERVLTFLDSYLSAAWNIIPRTDPPRPTTPAAPEVSPEVSFDPPFDPGPAALADLSTRDPYPTDRLQISNVSREDSDEGYGPPSHHPPSQHPPSQHPPSLHPPPLHPPPASSNSNAFALFSDDARFFLFQAGIREAEWPVTRSALLTAKIAVMQKLHPDAVDAQSAPVAASLQDSAERGAEEVARALDELDTLGIDISTTMQIDVSATLSHDARFFLNESGAVWPCELHELEYLRDTLLSRAGSPEAVELGPQWFARVERGFFELSRYSR